MSWLPLFSFVVLFGLSMDYTVLVLERIREARRAGRPPADAAAEGIAATAGTVTSAAVVMVAIFAVFATLRLLDMKQMGVGLAAAVLLDVTIVRGVALPAAITLLGERGWKVPRPGAARRAAASRSRPRMASGADDGRQHSPIAAAAARSRCRSRCPRSPGSSSPLLWALTGAGYFWPGWVWFGLAIAAGVHVVILRGARRRRAARTGRCASTREATALARARS